MNDELIIKHLMDIKERLASVEANTAETKSVVRQSQRDIRETDQRVDAIEKDLNQAKGSIKALKWGTSLMFITVPGVLFTVVRLLKL